MSDDDALSMKAARARYFEANGFEGDGGYSAKWVTGKFGPVPFAFPNIEARVTAVRFHALHHIVTGYQTDGVGEGEISAWEIASGCAGFWAAWLLNLLGMLLGFMLAPGAVFRAFVRGRRSQNLYRRELGAELLAMPVGELRRQLLLGEGESATTGDYLAFALWLAISAGAALGPLALLLFLLAQFIGWLF